MIKINKSFNIIKDALTYPLFNWKKMLVLSVLNLVITLIAISPELNGNGNLILSLITLIVGFILSFLIVGFHVNMIAHTVHGYDKAPNFNCVKDFQNGVGFVLLSFLYCLIPIVIIVIVAFVTGLLDHILQIGSFIMKNTIVLVNTNLLPDELIANTISRLGITAVVSFIVMLFTLSLFYIGLARFASMDNIIKGVDLGTIINTIDGIGIKLYLIWFIMVLIILLLLIFINFYLFRFSFLGGLIAILLIVPYMVMFLSRSIGLIYMEA